MPFYTVRTRGRTISAIEAPFDKTIIEKPSLTLKKPILAQPVGPVLAVPANLTAISKQEVLNANLRVRTLPQAPPVQEVSKVAPVLLPGPPVVSDGLQQECQSGGGKWDGRICVFPQAAHGPETTPTEHITETETGPTSPTDVPKAPSPAPTTQSGRGLFAPGTDGSMVAAGDNRALFEEILAKLDQCCGGGDYALKQFKMPGVEFDTCEWESLDDPNSAEGKASLAIRTYAELAAGNPAAATQFLDQTFPGTTDSSKQTGSATNWNALALEQTIRRWVLSAEWDWDFAMDWQLCWPVRAKWIRNDPDQNPGGIYMLGAAMAIAALIPVRMLSDMAYEIASASTEAKPVWPPGGGVAGKMKSADLKAALALANNIIANFLSIMRSIEAQTVKARDTLTICKQRLASGAGSEPTLVSGKLGACRCGPQRPLSFYLGGLHGGQVISPRRAAVTRRRRFSGLGATRAPDVKNRRTDSLAYALYFLSRFPAIYVYVPDNPASISEIATEVNRHLENLISYSRTLREELRQLTIMVQDCEAGISGTPPPQTPQPWEASVDFGTCGGTTSATGAVDPNAPISALPNPYAEGCVIPGVDTSGAGAGGGSGTGAGGAAPAQASGVNWLWVAAAAGAALVARGGMK